ncbi:MAG: hypothetical protein ACRDDX_02970 [Cellulosilyticaceae bacterium]
MVSREIPELIESIAFQEKALANILTAESEKLHKIVRSGCIEDMLDANSSATCLVKAINELEYVLKEELKLLQKYMNE